MTGRQMNPKIALAVYNIEVNMVHFQSALASLHQLWTFIAFGNKIFDVEKTALFQLINVAQESGLTFLKCCNYAEGCWTTPKKLARKRQADEIPPTHSHNKWARFEEK